MKDILMLFRAGDPTATLDCPRCGNRRVESQRIATDDEIPEGERTEPAKETL